MSLDIQPDTYPAPELTIELAEGFIVGVRMLYPEHTDEAVKKLFLDEWPGAFLEPKCVDIVETILRTMKGPEDFPLPLRDVAPGVLLGILRTNPKKYVERYQLEDLIHPSYPTSNVSQQIDDAIATLGPSIVLTEKDSIPGRMRYWRRGRPETA